MKMFFVYDFHTTWTNIFEETKQNQEQCLKFDWNKKSSQKSNLYLWQMASKNIEVKTFFIFSYSLQLLFCKIEMDISNNSKLEGKFWKILVEKSHTL